MRGEEMEKILSTLSGWAWGAPLLFSVLAVGCLFMVGSSFWAIRKFPYICRNTFFKMFAKKDGSNNEKGLLTPFQAVSVALASTIGVGNIGGVASAIAIGGPGAIFWMWVCAFFGMATKMAECTLAVYFRDYEKTGATYGGPTYYMEKGLGATKGWAKGLWVSLAVVFGAGLWSSFFLTVQNYTVSEAVASTFNIPMLAVSSVYVIIVYAITLGGIPRIGRAAEIIVPFMAAFYIAGSVVVLVKYAADLIPALSLIVKSAFTPIAAAGGFGGAAVAAAFRMGIARSIYSNEAGWGTAPHAHATARTDHPVRQGMWGAFEVFVDTILVCSCTALVIIVTGEWTSGKAGATLTLSAFSHGFGHIGTSIVALGIFLFGVTTTTGWYAYYETVARHLGHWEKGRGLSRLLMGLCKWATPLPGFLMVFWALRHSVGTGYVWLIADLTSAVPTFANLIAIAALSPIFFKLLKDYNRRILGEGKEGDLMQHVFYEDGRSK